MSGFDPDAAASGDGLFGLPYTPEEAALVLIPVPWDATTSYRAGTSRGPEAILSASRQVDLFDLDTGRPWQAGIAMLPISDEVLGWNAAARALAEPVIAAGGPVTPELAEAVSHVNLASERLNAWVEHLATHWFERGKIVGIVGGDHSTPLGAIAAAARVAPGLGILHIDAHADLREAYEGFTYSHASIMHNVLERVPEVKRLVQVAIRDVGEREVERIQRDAGRIVTFYDTDIREELFAGQPFSEVCRHMIAKLPQDVWISLDIDGLDPALCPNTGTPVPGGLQLAELICLLRHLVASGRHIVGFDLNEVAPGPDGDEWDGNVGARVLYKLCGMTLVSQGLVPRPPGFIRPPPPPSL